MLVRAHFDAWRTLPGRSDAVNDQEFAWT